jgi:hypothetical protein
MRRGKKRVAWHSFPADTTARCAAAKLLLFAVPLLGAGDEMSEDDEASIVPLTVGHVASHASAGAWLTWENVIDVGVSSSSPRQRHQKIPCAW